MTRELLWREYKTTHPAGLQYTAFCNQYRRWRATQEFVLRQDHTPGDKLFVDYAGHTVPVIDRRTDEERPAQVFVAVLGASNYTYVEATWSQTVPDRLGSQVRALLAPRMSRGATPEVRACLVLFTSICHGREAGLTPGVGPLAPAGLSGRIFRGENTV